MWKRRRGYSYINKNGKVVHVPPTYVWREPKTCPKGQKRVSRCPHCGATIETCANPKGGWAHFEPGLRHLGTLHPCFTRGRGLSKRRPDDMGDLFDDARDTEDET